MVRFRSRTLIFPGVESDATTEMEQLQSNTNRVALAQGSALVPALRSRPFAAASTCSSPWSPHTPSARCMMSLEEMDNTGRKGLY